jgi:aminopeptidase N
VKAVRIKGNLMREASAPVRLVDYRPHPYVIDAVSLDFTLEPHATRVKAVSQVRRREAAPAPLALDGAKLKLERIAIDGEALPTTAYIIEAERLVILDAPAAFSLEIETLIDPAGNTALEGLYTSGGRFCTQCEAEGFRKITYFIDRPDNLARYTVRMSADKAAYPTLLSNGDPIEQGDLADGRHYAVWRDPHPKPSYLFALVAGAFDSVYDHFVTQSGRQITLGIHVDPGDGGRVAYAMDSLKRSMRWDEEVFAREYDLDVFNIVAVRDFNFGAMENKGLNIFNAAYVLADPETATDFDFEAIESIVAHEYFHNWTGNRITCRDWFQLSLKEGLTVFRDQEFSADQRSRPVQRIKEVKRLRARQFPEDAGPLAHPVRPEAYQKIDNFYTATVYEKGAEVIRMMKALIGAEAFDRGIQLYFDRHDGQACTVEQWLACFVEASGQDLSHFAHWYSQAGTPRVEQTGEYDPQARTFTLSLRQTTPPTPGQPDKRPLPIPLRVGLISADGARLAAGIGEERVAREEHALVLNEAEQRFVFTGVVKPPIAAVLRGYSAPVILTNDLSEADRLAQMAHEPDAFTRWEAGQDLARSLLFARAAGTPRPASEDAFAEALSKELARSAKDPAFTALALRLPDTAELVQTAATPDPEALFAAREELRSRLSEALSRDLEATLERPLPQAEAVDAAAAGARAVFAAALDLYAAVGESAHATLKRSFDHAATMTESMAALEAMASSPTANAVFAQCLEAFYARWRSQPLIIDKWFGVQAAAPHGGMTLAEKLREHPEFTLRNPNRVRALISTFALRNVRAFHSADGSGYRFVGEAIAAVDRANPALAARLAGAFESWKRFDLARQAQARAVLEGLAGGSAVSKNLAEVLGRTLG